MSLVLGLDIGKTRVRGVFLRTTLRGSQIEEYVEAGYLADPNDSESLRQAVQSILSQSERVPDRIVAAIPGQELSIRSIEFPAGVAKRIAEVLPFEMEALLPFPLEDSIIDHQIISQDADKIQLLAVAAPKERVAERLRSLKSAGVEPRELAAGAAVFDGLNTIVEEELRDRLVVLIDIGETSTDVCLLSNGICEFARTLSGGMDLVEGGQRDTLGNALRRTLSSYRAQHDRVPDVALLSGDAAEASGAASWLRTQLEIECKSVSLPQPDGTLDTILAPYTRAAALAGRTSSRVKRIDLRQGEFASNAAASQLRKSFKLLLACATAVLFSFCFAMFTRYQVAYAENQALRENLGKLTQDLFKVETTSPAQARLLLSQGNKNTDPLPRFDAFDALDTLSTTLPSNIKHDTRHLMIEIDDEGDDGRLEVKGIVDSIEERDRILDELKAHRCLHALKKRGSISSAPENRKNYQMELKVHCPTTGMASKDKEKKDGAK